MTSITTSKPFIQDGMSFYLKTNDDTGVTTINRNNLIPLTQQEIDDAGQEFYDYATSEIQYATLTDGSFGPNWLEKNGGSSDWFNDTYTSEESKRIFEDSFGFTNPNAATTSSESNTNGTLENKDRKTTEVKEAYDKNKLYYPINEEESEYDYLQITGLEYIPAGNPDSAAFTDQSNIPQELRDNNNQSDYTWNDNFLTPISPQKRHQNKKIKGTVRLPMQPGISDSNSVGWSEDKLNAIELAGARLAGSAIGGISSWNLETIGEKWSEISKDLSDDITKQDILTYLAGAAIGKPSELFTRGTGQILNPNLELLFTGPSLRAFNYSFKFTPREPKEADNIKNIILFFKQIWLLEQQLVHLSSVLQMYLI